MTRTLSSVTFLAAAVAACSDAPVPLESHNVASPDSKWVAIVERVDNGLGFGLGALYHEVHVVREPRRPTGHGNRSDSVVFYVNSSEYSGSQPAVSVEWLSPTRLRVFYARSLVPGKQLFALPGITVEYSSRP